MAEDDRLMEIQERHRLATQATAGDWQLAIAVAQLREQAGYHAAEDVGYLLGRLAQARTDLGELTLVLEQQGRTLKQTDMREALIGFLEHVARASKDQTLCGESCPVFQEYLHLVRLSDE